MFGENLWGYLFIAFFTAVLVGGFTWACTVSYYLSFKRERDKLKKELSQLTDRFRIFSFFSFAAGGQHTLVTMDHEGHLYVLKQTDGGYEIVGPASPDLDRLYRLEAAIKANPISDVDDLVNRTGIQLPYQNVESTWPETAPAQAKQSGS